VIFIDEERCIGLIFRAIQIYPTKT
jgi:hypothetical protein